MLEMCLVVVCVLGFCFKLETELTTDCSSRVTCIHMYESIVWSRISNECTIYVYMGAPVLHKSCNFNYCMSPDYLVPGTGWLSRAWYGLAISCLVRVGLVRVGYLVPGTGWLSCAWYGLAISCLVRVGHARL